MFPFAGRGGLGDRGLPARAPRRRHPQHSHTGQLCGLLPKTLQLLRRRPVGGFQERGHRAAGRGRHAPSAAVDTRGRGPLRDLRTLLLRWPIRRRVEELRAGAHTERSVLQISISDDLMLIYDRNVFKDC